MALHIAEFAEGSIADVRVFQLAVLPPLAEQNLTVGGTSTQSAALNADTRIVRLCSDVACRVAFGANPTATVTSIPLTAGGVEYMGIPRYTPAMKLAVISA